MDKNFFICLRDIISYIYSLFVNNLWIFLKWIKLVLGGITTSDLLQSWLFLVRKLAPANYLKKLWKWYTNVDYTTILWKITRSYQKVTISNKRLQGYYKVYNLFALCSRCSPHHHYHTLSPSPILKMIILPYYHHTLYHHINIIYHTNIIWIYTSISYKYNMISIYILLT